MATINDQPDSDILIRQVPGFPDLLALHHANPERYPYLLESVAHGTPQARYDVLFAFPGKTLLLGTDRRLALGDKRLDETDFLNALDPIWRTANTQAGPEVEPVPFRGGWFLYLGYELAGQIEPRLDMPPAAQALPVAFATRIPAAIIRDHARGTTVLMAEADDIRLLDEMAADLADASRSPGTGLAVLSGALAEEQAEIYLRGIDRVLHYIVEGDVFQVNLSRQWTAQLDPRVADATLYQRLRLNNPAPFAGLMKWQDSTVISSSPERLVRVADRGIDTRPIAGTRPRGQGRDSDDAYSRELLAHPKERAEHIMLIDLERNDLGRICKPGSVEVNELMVLESYAHVHHIVSNVRGQLRADVTPGDVIRAVFPGGTITGCPKVRCMEIIAELERTGRGPYTGSMGYLNRDGGMDLNILIRTMLREGDRLTLRAGAGIVADSDPERELEETRAKARGLLLALEPDGEPLVQECR